MKTRPTEGAIWTPTSVQFLYKHRNGGYYVRTYAGGKEKWKSLRTKTLMIARNRMREFVDAAQRLQSAGPQATPVDKLSFGQALETYRREIEVSPVQPNTKRYRLAGIKTVLRSWEGIEQMNVRKITSPMVEQWFSNLRASAKPHVPPGAKSAARNSTGASSTTLICALDAVRQILDVAVNAGCLIANPARNASVKDFAKKLFKANRRERSQRGGMQIPSRSELMKVVAAIRGAGVPDCKAAAEFVQFLAFSGARRNEAVHVLWSDVYFEQRRIHLRVTKNGEDRYVPMTEEMETLLKGMKDQLKETAPSNVPVLRVKEAQGFITSACGKVGIPRFTPHALRHLFGTTCLEAGIDVRLTAQWMGHKDNGALLLKIYSHVRKQHETDMIKRIRFAAA
jgi:integrase